MKYSQRGEWLRILTRKDQRWVGNCGFGREWKHGRAVGHFSSQVFLWLRSIVECARVSECLVKYTLDKLSSRAYLSSCRVHHTFQMTLGWVGWGKVAWGRSGPASPVPGCTNTFTSAHSSPLPPHVSRSTCGSAAYFLPRFYRYSCLILGLKLTFWIALISSSELCCILLTCQVRPVDILGAA